MCVCVCVKSEKEGDKENIEEVLSMQHGSFI